MPYGGGSGVVVQQPMDVNTLFNDQTIDQLWNTLSEKRKECKMMQTHLRQLVGDRYKDLLSASDMIVGMGDICEYLSDDFEQTNAKRLAESTGNQQSTNTSHEDTMNELELAQLPETLQYITNAIYQIQAWLSEGRYLEAALCCKHTRAPLQRVTLLNNNNGVTGSYLSRQITKCQTVIDNTSKSIIEHSTNSLAKAQLTVNPEVPSLIGICCTTLCCISLLNDSGLLDSLKLFIRHQDVRLQAISQSQVDISIALSCVSALYTFRSFVYKVFIEHSIGLKDSIQLTSIAILSSNMETSKPIIEMSQYISSSDYFNSNHIDLLPEDLPAISDVKLLLSRWEIDTARHVSLILKSSLVSLSSVEEVTDLQKKIVNLSSLWHGEPLHAQPPAAWMKDFQESFVDRMTALFREELTVFENSITGIDGESDDANEPEEELQEISTGSDKKIALRYTIGRSTKETSFDPSIPNNIGMVLMSFEEHFQKITKSIELVAAATQENTPHVELTNTLTNMSMKINNFITNNPKPRSGILVQGISRIISQVVSRRSGEEGIWKSNAGALTPFFEQMHQTYLMCFENWTSEIAENYCSSISEILSSNYWGPEKEIFDQISYSSWEHREEVVDGSSININLPGSVTPGVLQALHESAGRISENLPSLLRNDVIAGLHTKMASAFETYKTFIAQCGSSICQPALWQILFDVRFIGIVCKSEDHPAYTDIITILMNPETGVDPVYWSTEKSLFEEILLSAIASSCLLLAVHGVKRPGKDKSASTRDASFVDFIPECPSRFVTYHLASLQQNPTTASSGLSSNLIRYSSVAAASGASQSQSSPSTLSGLQHLKALGTGLQQLKGTYFKW